MSTLTLVAAKAHLNINVDTYDATVQAFIDAAEAMIGERVGPLASTPVTCRVKPNGCRLSLPTIPAVSLTSVTPADSAALTLSDLYLNTDAAVVTYNSGQSFTARYYVVVYQAGRASIPADLLLAIKEQVRGMFEASQRGDASRVGEEEYPSNTVANAEFSLSFEVSRLIAPHIQPGFA